MRICSWKVGRLENESNQTVILARNSGLRNHCIAVSSVCGQPRAFMDRLAHANQRRQHFRETILLGIAECEVKLAVKRVELFVSTLLGLLRLKNPVRRANFILRFLDGLERSGGEKRKNCGTQ